MMEGRVLQLPTVPGFHPLKPVETGTTLISFVPKVPAVNEYKAGEATVISGLCKYNLLSSAGLVCGVLFTSPKSHTVLSYPIIKIGPCAGPFHVNQNLKNVGILLYLSADGSILIVPAEVSSPLLIEVDT